VHCVEQQCRSATELLSLSLSWRRAVSISIAWLTSPRRASCQGTDHMWEIKLIRLAYPFMTEKKQGHVSYFVNIQPGSYPEWQSASKRHYESWKRFDWTAYVFPSILWVERLTMTRERESPPPPLLMTDIEFKHFLSKSGLCEKPHATVWNLKRDSVLEGISEQVYSRVGNAQASEVSTDILLVQLW